VYLPNVELIIDNDRLQTNEVVDIGRNVYDSGVKRAWTTGALRNFVIYLFTYFVVSNSNTPKAQQHDRQ